MNVYDFDKTIYYGDSTADFYLFCLKRHKKILTLAPSLLGAFLKFYVFKRGTKTEFKEKMYRFLTFCDTEKDVKDFWKEYIGNIKPFYLEQKEDDDVIISASPEFLLKPVCKRLKIKDLIASKVDMQSGKYSGINCHGKEKVKRFYEVFPDGKIDNFYSDSYSDSPLAEIADKIVMGKIGKFYKENCLLDQEFVKDNKINIKQYTQNTAKELGGSIKIKKFVRFEKGEGIEKRQDDFAAEVASMVK